MSDALAMFGSFTVIIILAVGLAALIVVLAGTRE